MYKYHRYNKTNDSRKCWDVMLQYPCSALIYEWAWTICSTASAGMYYSTRKWDFRGLYVQSDWYWQTYHEPFSSRRRGQLCSWSSTAIDQWQGWWQVARIKTAQSHKATSAQVTGVHADYRTGPGDVVPAPCPSPGTQFPSVPPDALKLSFSPSIHSL